MTKQQQIDELQAYIEETRGDLEIANRLGTLPQASRDALAAGVEQAEADLAELTK